jgi:hypothetical protein
MLGVRRLRSHLGTSASACRRIQTAVVEYQMSACGCRCASLRAALRGCLAGRTKSMLVTTEVRGVGIDPHPNRPVPVPCRSQADPPAPFSTASDRSVTSMLTDERRTNDQGLTAVTGDQACDLLLFQ